MPEIFLKQFSILLKHYREARSLSQAEVASRLHIGNRTYQRFETGEAVPSLDTVIKIARELQFNIKDIFSAREIQYNPKFKFYSHSKSDKEKFLKDPLVVASGIAAIAETFIEKNNGDLEKLSADPAFALSPFYLAVTTQKNLILNSALQKKLGSKGPIVPVRLNQESMKERGLLWAYLLESNCKYFDEHKQQETPEGIKNILIKRIVITHNNQHYLFSVIDFNLNK